MQGLLPPVDGLTHSAAQFNQAAAKVTRASLPAPGGSDSVDLSTAAVALLQSKNSFEANTNVVKVFDSMEKTLIDMMA